MKELSALYGLAEENRVAVDCYALRSREALSLMDEEGECYIAIDPFQLKSETDEKLKLAHELGHCMTGSFYNRWAACDVRQKHERRANKWAIGQLVPRAELRAALRSGLTQPWELAEHFDVSEAFIRKAMELYFGES